MPEIKVAGRNYKNWGEVFQWKRRLRGIVNAVILNDKLGAINHDVSAEW